MMGHTCQYLRRMQMGEMSPASKLEFMHKLLNPDLNTHVFNNLNDILNGKPPPEPLLAVRGFWFVWFNVPSQ